MGKRLKKPKRQFGVRDPLKQLEERENKIKDKINNPPAKDENQQKLSQKMRKFLQLKSDAKNPEAAKAAAQKKKELVAIQKNHVTRHPGETEENYLRRLKRFKNSRLSEALYAAKYNVKINRDQDTGELSVKQGERNEIDEILLQKKLGKKKLRKKDPEKRKAAIEKFRQKKKDKKAPKVREEDPLRQVEVIPFGERVDAPPTLVTPRKAQKDEKKSKNARNGLLLTQILEKRQGSSLDHEKSTSSTSIDFKRVQLEKERESIVKLYKELKKKRREDDKSKGLTKTPGSSL